MTFNPSTKPILVIILMFAGIAGISYAVDLNNKNFQEALKLIQHTEKVISQTRNVFSLSKDIETSSRGYVLTKDSAFLIPLLKAEKIIFKQVSSLNLLTKDNPLQNKRVLLLEKYVRLRLAVSKTSIEIRNKKGLAQAIEYVNIKKGKKYSDVIRNIAVDIQIDENHLLETRKKRFEKSITLLKNLITAMLVVMLVFLAIFIFALGYTHYQNKEKIKNSQKLKSAESELELQHIEIIKQDASNKELEAFSYSVSHDLRAPLRHISGFVDLLKKQNSSQLDQTGLRYLNTISDSAKEMGNLIDALLSFSRLSRTDMSKTMIDTSHLVSRILATFQDEITKRKIKITTAKLPAVFGNEYLIQQVWYNLISNAIKYTLKTSNALIDIGYEARSNEIVYYIKDNGAGFNIKYVDKLFGVFQRLHKSSEFEGIGIGLANVKQIVNRHKGQCWATGEMGQGASFYFTLPNTLTN